MGSTPAASASPRSFLEMQVLEFLLWCNRIGGISGVLRRRLDPWLSTEGEGSGVATAAAWVCNCGLDIYISLSIADYQKSKI